MSIQSKALVTTSRESRLYESEHPNPNAHCETTDDAIKKILQSCRRRVRSWRIPPNWSSTDWFEEIEAIVAFAGWQSDCTFDALKGIKYEAFVYQKVMHYALTHYRREWRYALRFIPMGDYTVNEASDSNGSAERCDIPLERASINALRPNIEDLLVALSTLSKSQQQLIQHLYFCGYTQAEIGKSLGLSQRAISKREHIILRLLRRKLS